MRKALLATCSLVLVGCAQPGKWYHPTANQAQFEQDRLRCNYDAEKAVVNIQSGFRAGYELARLRSMCMESHGYRWQNS